MDRLDQLESKSIYIIREAYYKFPGLALLWSMGKDSTTLLWLCRKAFLGKIPFPVVHIDTGYKFPEMYEFRDEYAEKWQLDLHVVRNEEAIAAGMAPELGSKFECCHALKTIALKKALSNLNLDALLLGIRRDEHGIRAKERFFSPRDSEFQWDYGNQPLELWDQVQSPAEDDSHIRVHPLLHMTELDIWQYIQRCDIPVPSLYFSREGSRYRSIGCSRCCDPVTSGASTVDEVIGEVLTSKESEREGRAQDKEDATTMQKLRALGYM